MYPKKETIKYVENYLNIKFETSFYNYIDQKHEQLKRPVYMNEKIGFILESDELKFFTKDGNTENLDINDDNLEYIKREL